MVPVMSLAHGGLVYLHAKPNFLHMPSCAAGKKLDRHSHMSHHTDVRSSMVGDIILAMFCSRL